MKRWIYFSIGFLAIASAAFWLVTRLNLNPKHTVGQEVDNLHGVAVYYNGGVNHVAGRNTTKDGYNLGLKYQCVEFVKRYYYQHLHHKMPDSYGHAKDFFDKKLADGAINKQRNLTQYTNPSQTQPKVGDLLVFNSTALNQYGHVAIVSKVTEQKIELIQQNPGPFGKSREIIKLNFLNNKWKIDNHTVLGWLRKTS